MAQLGDGEAPSSWHVALRVAGWLAIVVALLAGVTLPRARRRTTVDDRTNRRYGRVVLVSYVVIAAGTAALLLAGRTAYVAPWVALVVGAHFLALAPVLDDRLLAPLGVVVVLAALVATVGAALGPLHPAFLTGVGTGGALLVVAAVELLGGLRSMERPDRR